MNPMPIETTHELIEIILAKWEGAIGEDYLGYKGHVYRMFNFCLALHPCTEEENTKLAIAACFHDMGLWPDRTLDYLPASISHAAQYLSDSGREEWSEEMALMIGRYSVTVMRENSGMLSDWPFVILRLARLRSTRTPNLA